MRHLRYLALALLAACGASKMASYPYASPSAVAVAADMPTGADEFVSAGHNPWIDATKDNLSTFAADVDTASYTIARRTLNEGSLPAAAGVRIEEFVNYFTYAFANPDPGSPFAVAMDAAPHPMIQGTHLLRVGVATKAKSAAERKPANLVFLVDVSGSMGAADKIGLAQRSLRILTENLGPRDSVSLVTYAGSTRVVLPPTGMEHRDRIYAAIDDLTAGGSTAMGSGLDLAYEQAMKGLLPGSISRVIVLTDGDANVGAQGHAELLRIIESRAKAGVTLSTIGFGMGNLKDHSLEQLADKGNGNYFYIDTLSAANKVFAQQLGSTLEVVAKDVKFQIEFDPTLVARYRLLGYENRDIADRDFRNDTVDAGEIGAGHQVSALYELQLTDAALVARAPLATLHLRHKAPDGDAATERTVAMAAPPVASFSSASADLRFAFAVAAFADILRGSAEAATLSLDRIEQLARDAAGDSPERAELVALITKARSLRAPATAIAR